MIVSLEILYFMEVAIFFSVISIIYKRNFMSVISNDIIFGMTAGMVVGTSFLQLQSSVLKGIQLGQPLYILPVIYGALYITFFIPQARYAFRVVNAIQITNEIALQLPVNFAIVYSSLYTYSSLAKGLPDLLLLIMYVIGLTTYTFAAWLEKPLAWPRRLGMYIVYTYCALQLAPNVFKFSDNLFAVVHKAFSSFPAILVPIALMGWITYDLIRTGQIPFLKAKAPVAK